MNKYLEKDEVQNITQQAEHLGFDVRSNSTYVSGGRIARPIRGGGRKLATPRNVNYKTNLFSSIGGSPLMPAVKEEEEKKASGPFDDEPPKKKISLKIQRND